MKRLCDAKTDPETMAIDSSWTRVRHQHE